MQFDDIYYNLLDILSINFPVQIVNKMNFTLLKIVLLLLFFDSERQLKLSPSWFSLNNFHKLKNDILILYTKAENRG